MAAAKKARPSADMKMSIMRNSYASQRRRDMWHSAVVAGRSDTRPIGFRGGGYANVIGIP
jgi:hypothetical protein